MDRIIYFAALLANFAQLAFTGYLVIEGYGTEALLAALLLLPPLLSLLAIHFSPDIEERALARQVRKAQLRADLADLEKGK